MSTRKKRSRSGAQKGLAITASVPFIIPEVSIHTRRTMSAMLLPSSLLRIVSRPRPAFCPGRYLCKYNCIAKKYLCVATSSISASLNAFSTGRLSARRFLGLVRTRVSTAHNRFVTCSCGRQRERPAKRNIGNCHRVLVMWREFSLSLRPALCIIASKLRATTRPECKKTAPRFLQTSFFPIDKSCPGKTAVSSRLLRSCLGGIYFHWRMQLSHSFWAILRRRSSEDRCFLLVNAVPEVFSLSEIKPQLQFFGSQPTPAPRIRSSIKILLSFEIKNEISSIFYVFINFLSFPKINSLKDSPDVSWFIIVQC